MFTDGYKKARTRVHTHRNLIREWLRESLRGVFTDGYKKAPNTSTRTQESDPRVASGVGSEYVRHRHTHRTHTWTPLEEASFSVPIISLYFKPPKHTHPANTHTHRTSTQHTHKKHRPSLWVGITIRYRMYFKAPKHTHPANTHTHRTSTQHTHKKHRPSLWVGIISATGDRCGAERWIALAQQRASSVKPSMREFSRQMTAFFFFCIGLSPSLPFGYGPVPSN